MDKIKDWSKQKLGEIGEQAVVFKLKLMGYDVVNRRSLILPCLEHGSASQNMVLRRYIFSISFVPLHHEA